MRGSWGLRPIAGQFGKSRWLALATSVAVSFHCISAAHRSRQAGQFSLAAIEQ